MKELAKRVKALNKHLGDYTSGDNFVVSGPHGSACHHQRHENLHLKNFSVQANSLEGHTGQHQGFCGGNVPGRPSSYPEPFRTRSCADGKKKRGNVKTGSSLINYYIN